MWILDWYWKVSRHCYTRPEFQRVIEVILLIRLIDSYGTITPSCSGLSQLPLELLFTILSYLPLI